MSRTVLIVGVTGIAGFNTAQAFSAAGWRVLGLSRSHRYDIPGVEQLRGDVLDPESLDRALAGQEFSHVVFTTWSRQENETENRRVNGAMLANLRTAMSTPCQCGAVCRRQPGVTVRRSLGGSKRCRPDR